MVINRKLISLVLVCLLIASFPAQAFATELGHKFAEQTTRQTRSDTAYADITGAVISNTNLTSGKKYLIVVTAQVDSNTLTGEVRTQLIHGSTVFEGSERRSEHAATATGYTYFWYTVWTAVASEDVKLQFASSFTGTVTIGIDQISMVAIKLSDDLTENTDWAFNENTINTTLAASYGTGNSATLTMTPSGTDNILVLATAQLDPTSVAVPQKTRINASGGVTSTGIEWMQEAEDAVEDIMVETIVGVFTPTASSTTFTTQSESSSATGTRLYNSVFWLNLNKMAVNAYQRTGAEISLDTTNAFATSTNVATVSMTPNITGDVWALGFFVYDTNSAEALKARIQVDNTDQPDTQTSDDYVQLVSQDNADELPLAIQSIENLDNTSHTLDVDATKSTTARPVEDRLAMMVTMELPVTSTKLYLRGSTTPNSPTNGEKSTALPVGTFTGNSGDGFENLSLSTTKGSSQTSKTISSLIQLTHQDMYPARFSSQSLAAQTFSAGTWTLALATSESDANAESQTVGSIYVYRPTTATVVGYIYDSDTALGIEYSTTEDGQVVTVSGSSVTSQDGDILVFEYWIHATQLISLGYTNTLYFDGTTDVVDSTSSDAASYIQAPISITFSTNCSGCNLTIQQNQGWIFALAGVWNFINQWFIPQEQQAEAQVQEPISFKFKVVPKFTSTRSETQIRNFFNNQIIPKLETAVNNRLSSEFTNPQVTISLNLSKTGTSYEVYPKIIISGVTQTQIDSLLQKYDLAVDDMTTTMLTDINNSGINNVKFHIHKSFGSINT